MGERTNIFVRMNGYFRLRSANTLTLGFEMSKIIVLVTELEMAVLRVPKADDI